jgi:MFS family permease
MLTGLVALLVRYVAFWCGGVFDMQWLYFIAILVHGVIFGFFFVGGQIYVDKKAPKEIRAQAQGFMFLITFGIGMLLGNFFNGALITKYSTEVIVDGVKTINYNWDPIWKITTAISAVLLVAFFVFFRDKLQQAETVKEDA